MASIQKRTSADGDITYRVQVRLKGHPSETASFARLTDACPRKYKRSVDGCAGYAGSR